MTASRTSLAAARLAPLLGSVLLSALLAGRTEAQTTAPAATRELALDPATATFTHEFDGVWGVRELSDGLLLVDARDGLIALDPRSGLGRLVGQRGRGPGEYLDVGTLIALPGDSTLFADPSNRRLVYLHRDRIVRVTEANDAVTTALGTSLAGADATGRIVADRAVPDPLAFSAPRQVGTDAVLRLDPRTMRVDTITTMRGMEISVERTGSGPQAGYRTMTVVFAAEDIAWVAPDGWIGIARQQPYRVDWHPPTGAPRLGAPIEREAPRVTEAEKADWKRRTEEFTGKPFRMDLNSLPWAETIAPFAGWSPVVLADGNVLLARMPWSGSRGTELDLIDRRGARLGTLRLPTGERVVGSGRGVVYVAVKDGDGIERIRRHPWR